MRRLLLFLVLWSSALAVAAKDDVARRCLAELTDALGAGGDALGATPALERLETLPAVVLDTARLELRTPRRADMAELMPIFQDGPTVKFTWFNFGEGFWNLGRVGAQYEKFAKGQLAGQRQDFMIRQRADGALVGRFALYGGVGPGSWEMGITLYRLYWGRRYAPETMEEALRYVFEDLGGTELRFRTEPENEPMLVQYPRLGIPKVIDAKDDVPEAPFFHRYHHFALTRDQWRARRRP